jgi:glucokinase
MEVVIGVDIGGSHISAAFIDGNSKKIVFGTKQRLYVNAHGTVSTIINEWSTAIIQTLGASQVPEGNTYKVGIALPGPCDYENGISLMDGNNKYAALFGLNIKTLLSQKLSISQHQICLMNDAAGFLKGELYAGAARGMATAIGLTLGTGLGSATFNGTTVTDANFWCLRFKEGIAEDYLSTRWFVTRYEALSKQTVKGVKELADLYTKDENVQFICREFAINLSDFLIAFIQQQTLQPQIIVIGGNIMNCSHLFLPEVTEILLRKGYLMPIVKSQLGEEAAIVGASTLFEQNMLVKC